MGTAVKSKVASKGRVTLDNGAFVKEYVKLLEQKDALDERIEGMREYAKDVIASGGAIETEDGKFQNVTLNSLSWTLEDLKSVFPDDWENYAQANNSLVKKFVDSQVASGKPSKEAVSIKKRAEVKQTVQLRFNRK